MENNKRFLRELRCKNCHRLLFKEYIYDGYVEVKCPGCKQTHQYRFTYYKNLKKKDDIIILRQKVADSDLEKLKAEKGKK